MILTNRFLLRILQANKMNGNFFSNKKMLMVTSLVINTKYF